MLARPRHHHPPLRFRPQAFQGLGGNADKTGSVCTSKLKEICEDFELSIKIDELLALYDRDNSGFIDYDEFALMLKDDDAGIL